MTIDEATAAGIAILLVVLFLIGAVVGWERLLLAVGIGVAVGIGAAVALERRNLFRERARPTPPQAVARRCPSCRATVPADRAICPACLSDLKVNCPECGAVVDVETLHCPNCRSALPAKPKQPKRLSSG
jgi:RNA polymerase subunit RPABC4/transcription elongation factor Spt4